MREKYFYDLPVYRLPRAEYYAARDAFVAERNPRRNDALLDHLQQLYGGCWEFNEIVGYIRLHFLGTQVRGEYHATAKQRVVRTRTKTFEYQTHKLAPEVSIASPFHTKQILEAIREYIDKCKREIPRRFVDTEKFEAIAPFVDWEALFSEGRTIPRN